MDSYENVPPEQPVTYEIPASIRATWEADFEGGLDTFIYYADADMGFQIMGVFVTAKQVFRIDFTA